MKKINKPLRIFSGKQLRKLFIFVMVVSIYIPGFLSYLPQNSKPILAATQSYSSQADFMEGKYEYGEIDALSSAGNLKLQADLGTWDASGPAYLNHNVNTNTKLIKAGNFLYLFRNRQIGQFLRYDLTTREWKEMAYTPTQPYEVIDATSNHTDTIWAFATRSGRKHFLKYDIPTDTWTYLDSTPLALTQGSTLQYVPGTTNYVYAFQGGGTSFWRYNITNNSWSQLSNAVATCTNYCSLEYDGSQYLYLATDALVPDRFYRYDTINGGVWVAQGNMLIDGAMNYGSDLIMSGSSFYVMRSGGTQTFYKYYAGAWQAAKDAPFVTTYGSLVDDPDNGRIIAMGGVGEMAYYYPANNTWSNTMKGPPANGYQTGSSLASDGAGNFYMCRGQGTTTCYKYVLATDTWTATTVTTTALSTGTALAYVNSKLYANVGNANTIYNYNGTTWATSTSPAATLGDGSAMVASGSGATGAIFAAQGAGGTGFYRYDATANTWATKTVVPEPVYRGSGLAQAGIYTYLLNGGMRGKFFRYSESANAWEELNSLPIGSYYGGGLVSDGSTYVYAFVGGENDGWAKRVYRYTISTGEWTRMADAPAMMRFGAGKVFYNNAIYVYQGYGGSFWKYTPPTTTYKSSGIWTSPVQDLIAVSSFGNYTVTESKPGGTDIQYYTRTSNNQNSWDDWVAVSGSTIGSTPRRYVQTKVVFTGNGTATPTLSDIAINYTSDTSVPDVSGLVLTAKSQKNSATSLVSGNSYNYTNPYFSWTGVTDSDSGVDGYYVYFGSSSTGDPVTLGNFQYTTDFVVNTPMISGTEYYLRIAPKNKANTTPVAATYFSYTYTGNSPAITATVANTQDEWDSTDASKSASYTSGSAWWNHAYSYRRMLTIASTAVATPGATVKLTLDTASLVGSGKMRSDRNDLRIAFWDGTFWKEIDRQYVDATTTFFPLVKGIAAAGSDTNYYVYYGNSSETTSPAQSFDHAQALAKWGSALRFDGSDYVRIPNVINTQSKVTIEGWFKYYNSSAARWLYAENGATPQVGIGIPANANWMTYNFKTLTAGTFTAQLGSTLLVPETWNHFAITYDSTTGVFNAYINGRLDATRSSLSGAVSVTGGLQQYLGANSASFHYGLIDEVRISNNVRYASAFTPPTDLFSNDANTLSLYHFDTSTGSQNVTDSSSNGNTGALGATAGALEPTDPQWTGDIVATVGSEGTAPVSAADTALTLEPLPEGSWSGSQLTTLPYGARMQNGGSVYANNNLYVLRGNATTAFYKQDVTTGIWTQLSDIPLAANGAVMEWDGNDAIYVIRGSASTTFYKYTISTNSWSAAIDQPIYTFTTGATITRIGTMYYMGIGGGSTTMLSFNSTYESTSDGNDAWSTLQTSPYAFSQGSGLVTDGNGSLWQVSGSSTGFAKYSIASDTWNTTIAAPALAPYFIGYSSNNAIYRNNHIYTFTSYDFQANGEAKHFIWSYDIAADKWEKIDNATEFWSYTGAVAYDRSRYAYLIQGYGNGVSGTSALVRYDLELNKFYPETPPLPLDRLYQADGEVITHQGSTTTYGTAMAFDGSDTIYMIQGNSTGALNTTTSVNKYQVSTKKWSMVPNIPCNFSGGITYANDKLYAICGSGTKKAYSFDPLTNDWTTLANNPGNAAETITSGGQIAVYNGSDAIYVLRGGATTTLYKYTLSSNTWTTESTLIPGSIGNNWGSSLVYDGVKYLYVIRGNNTNDMYRYDTSSPAWVTMSALPETVSNGSGAVLTNGKIYVTTSYNNNGLYIYDIATNSWQNGPLTQSQVSYGGTLVKGPGNSMYALQGNTMFTFWKYNLPSSSSSFKNSGTYTSRIVDLGKPYAFTGLTATVASPSATSISFETRTSTDSATWGSWTAVSDIKQNPSNQFVYAINSTVGRYIQTRVSMSSEENASTPTISDISVQYYQDITAPSNPTSLSAYTSATKAATLTDSVWNGSHTPYFEWSGASDGATGTGVAGYYVYFGTDSASIASVSGILTSAANYTANLAVDHSQDGYYYLKIQAVDSMGNIAAPEPTVFTYRYIDVTAPSNPTSAAAYADNTRTATLSAGIWYNHAHPYFEWTGATDDANGSGVSGYYVYFGTNQNALASQSGTLQTNTYYSPTMQTDGSDAGDYYLNIQVRDAVGNISTTNMQAFVYNHIDTTAPTIPTTLDVHTSTATMAAVIAENTWYNFSSPHFEWSGATDELNGSGISGYYVYFGSDPLALASQSGSFQVASSYTASLPTNSLEDGDHYLIIQTKDAGGNLSATQWNAFHYKYDHTAPTAIATENVAVLPNGYSSTNSYRFLWIATDDQEVNGSLSGFAGYYYKTGTSSGALSQDQFTTDLSVNGITAYQEGTNTFYIRAADVLGNYTNYTTVNYYYNSTAPSAPRNLSVDESNAGANKFNFVWDEPLTYRGSMKEYRYSVNETPNASNISTASGRLVNNIKGTHDGANIFYVVGVDDAYNVNYGNYASISFSVSVSAPGIPLAPEAFDNSIRSTQQYRVGLTWDPPTDKGSAFDRYEVYASETNAECSTDMSTFVLAGSTAGTSYVATSIGETNLESKAYYFCIQACATTNQCSSPSTTVTMTPSGRWLTAPDMVGSQSATVKTKTATISWNTDRTSNSFVKYGKTSGSYATEVGSSEQVSYHEIDVTGLDPGTTYYYKMLWTDEDGNLGESEEKTFATNPAPNVSTVKFSKVNINSAQVTFTIKSAIKATIQYGKTTSYGSIQTIATSKDETTYSVEVASLLEGTVYHLRIAAEDDEGNFYYSDDYTFETLPTPKIIGLRLQQVVGMPTATIRLIWTTNTLASAIVTYYPSKSPQLAADSVSLPLRKTHETILKNLLDDTDYTITVKGKDASGNEATPDTRTIKTANDMRAPEIQNLNVESTIIGVGEDARAQIVVSWDTDEPSTTQIEYGQGTGSTYNQTTQLDSNKTSNHIVTITGLSPSKIYHLRALSKDKADNIAQSLDTVIITPKSTKDALNLVIDNLSKTFGFLKVFIK